MKEQEARIGNENPTWIDHEVENQGLAKYCTPLVGAYANRIDANNVYFLTSGLIKC